MSMFKYIYVHYVYIYVYVYVYVTSTYRFTSALSRQKLSIRKETTGNRCCWLVFCFAGVEQYGKLLGNENGS